MPFTMTYTSVFVRRCTTYFGVLNFQSGVHRAGGVPGALLLDSRCVTEKLMNESLSFSARHSQFCSPRCCGGISPLFASFKSQPNVVLVFNVAHDPMPLFVPATLSVLLCTSK